MARPKFTPESARKAQQRSVECRREKSRLRLAGLAPLPDQALPAWGTVLDAMNHFGDQFAGESWDTWRIFLKALFGLSMTAEELAVYQRHTERQAAPAAAAREAWLIVGRRGGKSRVAALVAVYLACRQDYRTMLAPGEKGTVMLLAADRDQARVLFRYIAGLLEDDALKGLVVRRRKEAIELVNGVAMRFTRPPIVRCVAIRSRRSWRTRWRSGSRRTRARWTRRCWMRFARPC